jgi:hypothetical protein
MGGEVEVVDEFHAGFGWIEDEFIERCSHALVANGRVWLVDPVDADGLEERVRAAGAPAGVIQLLDRHARDCVVLANRLRVPHHVVPEQPIPPFEFVGIRNQRRWQEVALWWPDERVLVCADALGTSRYFRFGLGGLAASLAEAALKAARALPVLPSNSGWTIGAAGRVAQPSIAVHPLLRLRPPRQLASVAPDVILCGHGRGVLADGARALARAL